LLVSLLDGVEKGFEVSGVARCGDGDRLFDEELCDGLRADRGVRGDAFGLA